MAGNAAATIRVVHHQEDGRWWSESSQMPGWSAAGDSLNEVTQRAEEAVRLWAADYGFSPEAPICHLWGEGVS